MRRIETAVLAIDPVEPAPAVLAEAGRVLRAGGLVAFPTETVYGLGANAFDEAAVRRVFEAKERAADDPLIVHIARREDLALVARELPPLAETLAAAFWPGPLTLVLARREVVAPAVSAGLGTVAVRVPRHPVARGVIEAAGVPIAAPSANRFTRTSATTAEHVLEDLGGRIDLVLDGGPCEIGLESTVVDLTGEEPRLLRAGAIALEEIEAVAGHVGVGPRREGQAPSPGMMAKHYAPRAHLVLVRGPREAALAAIRSRLDHAQTAGEAAGLIVSDEDAGALARPGILVERLGPADRTGIAAHRLYAAMRALDAAGATVVFARVGGEAGLGRAIADRLTRAAAEVLDAGEG